MINAGTCLLGLTLAATPAAAVEVPGTNGRARLGGWVEAYGVVDTGSGPRQRPLGQLTLTGDARLARALRFRGEVRGRVGGPPEGGSVGIWDLQRAYENRSPSLEIAQALLELRLRRADLRLGIQTFAWGKLDGVPPTDVLNPRDYHDPIVQDPEERKIGVPAAALAYYPTLPRRWGLRSPQLTLVWVPWALPARMALTEERWFPTSTALPASVTVTRPGLGPLGPIAIGLDTKSDAPPRTLDAGAVGVRVGASWGGLDWDLYHYTGPETGPNVRLEADLRARPSGALVADARLVQEHDTIHLTGADLAFVAGPIAVRAEVAHGIDRAMLRVATDLIGPEELTTGEVERLVAAVARTGRASVPLAPLFANVDVLEWGIGADGVWHGVRPLLQVSQVVVLDAAPRLLVHDPETRIVGRVSRSWLGDRLEAEARLWWAIERGAWFVHPRISYLVRDDLRVRVGYLAIGGPGTSLIGQFKRNDSVLLQARWSF